MPTTWTFDDGLQRKPYSSFPYAYRALYNALKRGVEQGKKYDDMVKNFRILTPFNTVYNYKRATELATQQGLLTSDGMINSKEFRRK